MSYGIIRVQKMTVGSVRGIQIHDEREKEHSNTNPDIDYSKTYLNYSLRSRDNESMSYYNTVKTRIQELNLPKAVRKDAIVMCQCLVTSDRGFFEELQGKMDAARSDSSEERKDYARQYFERAFEFIKNKYGVKNIVSATVHMDEATPHMHVNFVPVTSDGRLCAKDLFKKQDLFRLHDEFYEQVGKLWGLQRGETREEKRHHLTTEQYKLEVTQKQMKEQITTLEGKIAELTGRENELQRRKDALQGEINAYSEKVKMIKQEAIGVAQEAEKASKIVFKARKELEGIKEILPQLKAEYDVRKTFIEQSIKDSQVSKLMPDYAEISQRGLFNKRQYVTVPIDKWEARHLSVNQIEALRKGHEVLERGIATIWRSAPTEKIKGLENEIRELKAENRDLSHKLDTANSNISRMNRVFKRYPDIEKAFADAETRIQEQKRSQQSDSEL